MGIKIKNLKKIFHIGPVCVNALNGVNVEISTGECLAITGESGSGKSTLLHILGTLDLPTEGKIEIDGKDPFAGNDNEMSYFRNQKIGFVFQQNNLLPEFTALENVMLPGFIAKVPKNELLKNATDFLVQVGLSHRLNHYAGELSGGEQQRVAIARALINHPALILADEPSGSLDSANAENIHKIFLELNKILNTSIIIVTHNMDFADSLPRKVTMKDGVIVADERRK